MNSRIFMVFLSSALSVWGCETFVQVDPPIDQMVSKQVFSDEPTANAALNGLYSEVMNSNFFFLNGGLTIYGGLSAGELDNRVSSATREEFRTRTLQPTNSDNDYRLWRKGYSVIYLCNALLEGSQTASLDARLLDRIVGEALFMRALHYFYLTNLYGPVPLVVTTDAATNAMLARTPVADIYATIEEDLKRAEALLPDIYSVAFRAKPNRACAQALLARFYRHTNRWEEAYMYSDRLITSGEYALEQIPTVFEKESEETILQLYPVNDSFKATAEAQYFIPTEAASSLPTILISEQVVERFEPKDLRLTEWVGSKSYLDNTYHYPSKYNVRLGEEDRQEYNVLFRLAEQYLIRAEAAVHMDDLDGAVESLNAVRTRAGLEALGRLSADQVLEALIAEKGREFFAEVGHGWLDLMHWGFVDDGLYPIPQYELDSNPFLYQNDGY